MRRTSHNVCEAALLSAAALSFAAPIAIAQHAARQSSAVARTSGHDNPHGYLFIVGGGPQPASLVQDFVKLAGGAGHARIIVFAMASEDGKASGEEKAEDLRKLGAEATSVFVDHDQANTDSVAHLLDGATGVWFGGGDQVLLTKALLGTRTEAAIRARYQSGAVVGGTSAGAAVMSNPMITGDERHRGGDRPPADTTDAFMTIARDNMIMAPGFGLIRGAIVDQHFLRRKRHNRLMSVVLERPEHLGVGIDESTALVVFPDGHWEVRGASAASVYDARQSRITPPAAHTLGATNVIVHILPAGSSFDPRTGKATLPRGAPSFAIPKSR